jgi:hypothetical protein
MEESKRTSLRLTAWSAAVALYLGMGWSSRMSRGKAPDVCLAQPNGLGNGTHLHLRAKGPAICCATPWTSTFAARRIIMRKCHTRTSIDNFATGMRLKLMSVTYGIEERSQASANGRAIGPDESTSANDPGLRPGLCKRVGLWPADSPLSPNADSRTQRLPVVPSNDRFTVAKCDVTQAVSLWGVEDS